MTAIAIEPQSILNHTVFGSVKRLISPRTAIKTIYKKKSWGNAAFGKNGEDVDQVDAWCGYSGQES